MVKSHSLLSVGSVQPAAYLYLTTSERVWYDCVGATVLWPVPAETDLQTVVQVHDGAPAFPAGPDNRPAYQMKS